MNLQETVELLHALKASGAKYFKSSDMEVRLGENSEPEILTMKPREPIRPAPIEPKYDPVATKQTEDLIDLLKMKDEELVNKIFPAGS